MPRRRSSRYNAQFGGKLARGMQGWPTRKGLVQGYCFGKAFYGTVQPLLLAGPEGNLEAVWARFVLVTSVLLFFRFSTLLTRNGMDSSIARK
jgi:hypothetical protein